MRLTARDCTLIMLLALLIGVITGAFVTFQGMTAFDDRLFLEHSVWLMNMYGLGQPTQAYPDYLVWYGPLWDTILGLLTTYPFAFLRDPTWVRHAFNFALWPLTLAGTALLLARNGTRAPTIAIVIGMLVGYVRWNGHALVNTRDFPFACAFLIVTLAFWVIARGHVQRRRHPSLAALAGLAAIALVPPLIRIPAFLHSALLVIGCVIYAIMARGLSPQRRIAIVLMPIVVSIALLAALYPALWFFPSERWLQPLSLFGNWPQDYVGKIFGGYVFAMTTPRWYPFAWPFVGFHPIAFITFIAGLMLFAARGARSEGRLRIGQWRIGVEHALLAFFSLSWLPIFFLQSTLYDEERHILFLYLPLLVIAGLAMHRFSDRLQYALAAILIIGGLSGFLEWGRYAYIYKSPLVLNRDASEFGGDYWAVCVAEAAGVLPTVAPEVIPIVMGGASEILQLEIERRREGLLRREPGYPQYSIVGKPPETGPYLFLAINRIDEHQTTLADIARGRAKLLWLTHMPLGEPNCILARYPGN